MNEEIWIDISPTGDVTIEGKNFSGSDCKAATAAIEDALGEVTKVELKPEYHRTRAATRTSSR